MLRTSIITGAIVAGFAGSAIAGDFDTNAAHAEFTEAFNNRQWDQVQSLFTDDSVFHRAGAAEVYSGPKAIRGRFESTIGGEWNVKFVRLDSTSEFAGSDGRIVERGDFAITAGGDDSTCYAGSYMMTWASQEANWGIQVLSWQDLETDIANCQ